MYSSDDVESERFSRWMSYVLRHNPSRYALTPDEHGFVDLDDFIAVARRRYLDLTPERLRKLIEESSRSRFEIKGNQLRARYGHSISVTPPGDSIEPPEQLYHGTEPAQAEHVIADGIKPMDRQMVHLSATIEDAVSVASRRTSHPAVLKIDARNAHRQGVVFYHEGPVYLTAHVPPAYLGLVRDDLNPL